MLSTIFSRLMRSFFFCFELVSTRSLRSSSRELDQIQADEQLADGFGAHFGFEGAVAVLRLGLAVLFLGQSCCRSSSVVPGSVTT